MGQCSTPLVFWRLEPTPLTQHPVYVITSGSKRSFASALHSHCQLVWYTCWAPLLLSSSVCALISGAPIYVLNKNPL